MPFIPMIDTLIGTFDIKDYDDSARNLLEKLDKKKFEAKIALTENSNQKAILQIGPMNFEVLSNGKKGYAYLLHNELYEINLSQYRSKNRDFYPVYIKVKSECLWAYGPYKAWNDICEWVKAWIGEPIDNKISRIDLCCHTDEIQLYEEDIENFKGQYYTEQMYRYRRNVNAMCFGSSASNKVYCRIYDKVLEVTQKNSKKWFFSLWKERGLNPKKVWNVEFQLNRDFLKDRNLNTVWQTFDSLGSIWKYCTETWLVKIYRDNLNVSRCSIDKEWQGLQKAFSGFKSEPLIKREKQLNDDAESIVPSAYGFLTTIAAKKGITDISVALQTLQISGESYLRSKKLDFARVVNGKKKLLDSQKKERSLYDEIQEDQRHKTSQEVIEKILSRRLDYERV